MLVQIAVCKCHPKFIPGGAEIASSARWEGQEYEEVDGGEDRGVAESDPTYMEVGEGERGNAILLKENEAYGDSSGQLEAQNQSVSFQFKGNEAYDETSPFNLKGNEAYDETSPFQFIPNEAYCDIKQLPGQGE